MDTELVGQWVRAAERDGRRATDHTRREVATRGLPEAAPTPGCTCLRCAVLRLGGGEEDVTGAERVVGVLAQREPGERLRVAEAIRADTRWMLPSARMLTRYARSLAQSGDKRSVVAIELELPAPGRRPRRRGREREPLPVEQARQVPLLAVVERLGLGPPRKVGREYVTQCPFHDDRRPSLCINTERRVWKCWPCAEGGDGIELVRRVMNVSFVDAVRWLTN